MYAHKDISLSQQSYHMVEAVSICKFTHTHIRIQTVPSTHIRIQAHIRIQNTHIRIQAVPSSACSGQHMVGAVSISKFTHTYRPLHIQAVPSSACSGQHMVGAASIVSQHLGSIAPDEESAVVVALHADLRFMYLCMYVCMYVYVAYVCKK